MTVDLVYIFGFIEIHHPCTMYVNSCSGHDIIYYQPTLISSQKFNGIATATVDHIQLLHSKLLYCMINNESYFNVCNMHKPWLHHMHTFFTVALC